MRSNTLSYWSCFLLLVVLGGCGKSPEETPPASKTDQPVAETSGDSATNSANNVGINPTADVSTTVTSAAKSTGSNETITPAVTPPKTENPVVTTQATTAATAWGTPQNTDATSQPMVKKLNIPTNDVVSHEASDATVEGTTRRMGTPQLAVTTFLNAIRDGNNVIVEDMLSNRARKNVTEMGLVVTPPADPSMEFTLGEVEMLGETGASVTCDVHCDAETSDGQTIRQTVPYHWVLRQEPVRGWRIAGATMKIQADEPPVMFDFENLEETLRKIAAIEQSLTR